MTSPAARLAPASERSFLGVPRSAAAEIVVFYAAALVVDALLLDGTRFRDLAPHPFWLFLLVIAAHYGTAAGVFAAVLGTLLAFMGNLPPRDPLVNQSAYLLAVLGKPVLWFASAVVLGELRTRQERTKLALQAQLTDLQAQTSGLQLANDDLARTNERLRTSAAGQIQTAVTLVEAARTVETQETSSVFSSVDGLIQTLLTPTAYSIYLHGGDHLDLVVHTTDGKTPDALQRYGADTALYRAVVTHKQVVHVATPEGLEALGRDGILAGPLLDTATGTALGMLKIEGMPLTMLRADALHAFRALCEWIGSAYRNAQRYEDANRSRVSAPGSQLFTDAYYKTVSTFVLALAERARFEVTQLTLRVSQESTRSGAALDTLPAIIEKVVTGGLRSTDLAFDYHKARGEYLVILPMTQAANGQIVADRLRSKIDHDLAEQGLSATIFITFETLYVPTPDDVKPWHRPLFRRTAPYTI